jgi:hypothetical protein
MSEQNFQDQPPAFTFLGNSPVDELRDIARIHHDESRDLLNRALQAKAEGRLEEASLLKDLSFAREKRAWEFERAAKGETGDPIVTEILDDLEEARENYTPYSAAFVSAHDLPEMPLPEHMRPRQPGRIGRAISWFANLLR